MSDEESRDVATDAETAAPEDADIWARETAPQSPYTSRQVGIGLLVFAVCAIVAFGLPLALI